MWFRRSLVRRRNVPLARPVIASVGPGDRPVIQAAVKLRSHPGRRRLQTERLERVDRLLWAFLLKNMPTVERAAFDMQRFLAPGLKHIIKRSDRALPAPDREQ